MPRQVTDIAGVARQLGFVDGEGNPRVNIVYKLVRRAYDPLPYKKIGKHLRFDVERVWAWFDRQPGRDEGLVEELR